LCGELSMVKANQVAPSSPQEPMFNGALENAGRRIPDGGGFERKEVLPTRPWRLKGADSPTSRVSSK